MYMYVSFLLQDLWNIISHPTPDYKDCKGENHKLSLKILFKTYHLVNNIYMA